MYSYVGPSTANSIKSVSFHVGNHNILIARYRGRGHPKNQKISGLDSGRQKLISLLSCRSHPRPDALISAAAPARPFGETCRRIQTHHSLIFRTHFRPSSLLQF